MHRLNLSFFLRFFSPIYVKVNIPSVTFWYNEGYDISEIATSYSPLRCICSGRKFVKELRLLFGEQIKEALETSSTVKESMTTDR